MGHHQCLPACLHHRELQLGEGALREGEEKEQRGGLRGEGGREGGEERVEREKHGVGERRGWKVGNRRGEDEGEGMEEGKGGGWRGKE